MKNIKIILLATFVALFVSCSEKWNGEKDFRNFLRDKHPYSELVDVNFDKWTYIVNDTLKNKRYIYESSIFKSSLESHELKPKIVKTVCSVCELISE